MRILGIDPGYATIGFGVIEAQRGEFQLVQYGVITTPPDLPFPERLAVIYDDMNRLLDAMNPDVILEIVPDEILRNVPKESLDAAWQRLSKVNAVRNQKIFRIAESEAALIPGPSMVLWAEKTAAILSNF